MKTPNTETKRNESKNTFLLSCFDTGLKRALTFCRIDIFSVTSLIKKKFSLIDAKSNKVNSKIMNKYEERRYLRIFKQLIKRLA